MPTTVFGTATPTGISPRINAIAEKALLDHAEPILVLHKFAQHKAMPKNKGEVLKMRRPNVLPLALTPLTEGVTPTPTSFSYTDVNATLAEYGDWTELTSKIADLHEDPVGRHMAMMLGEQAAETIEILTYNVVKAGTNVQFSGGTSTITVDEPMSLNEQRKAVRFLRAQRAKPITSILAPSTMIGTTSVEGGYVALTHSDVAADLRAMAGFVPVADYGSRKPLCPEEIGSVEDVRYITSPLFAPALNAGGAAGGGGEGAMLTSGSNTDVYNVIFLSANAFASVALKGSKQAGGAIKLKIRQPGTIDSNDPMGRTGSLAWSTWFVCKVLNEAWILRVEVGARVL